MRLKAEQCIHMNLAAGIVKHTGGLQCVLWRERDCFPVLCAVRVLREHRTPQWANLPVQDSKSFGPHLAALALFPHPGTQGPLSSPQFINGLESKSCSTSWTSAQQFQLFPQIELEQQVQSRVHPQPLSEALVNRAV